MSDLETIKSKVWAMANELRGNMDASEYKNYILAFMFYRYLSEHQEQYLLSNNVIDLEDGQTINEAYKAMAVSEDLADYIKDISSALGYAIEPNDTWASLVEKIENSEVIPSDYQTIFANFEEHAKLNKEAEKENNARREEIENRSGVQTESPKAIQSQVDDKNAGHDKGYYSEISLPDAAEYG